MVNPGTFLKLNQIKNKYLGRAAMAFVLDDVINEIEETRSLDPLKKLKKENLVKVAAHYGITPAVGATKSHILDLIKDHCIENNIIDEVEEKPIAETAEAVRLK